MYDYHRLKMKTCSGPFSLSRSLKRLICMILVYGERYYSLDVEEKNVEILSRFESWVFTN